MTLPFVLIYITKAFDLVSRDGGSLKPTFTAEHDRVFPHRLERNSAVQWQLLGAIRHPMQRRTWLRPCSNALFIALLLENCFDTETRGICMRTRSYDRLFNLARLRASKNYARIRDVLFAALWDTNTEALPVITIDDHEVDVVYQFTYLGFAINDNLSLDK